MAESLRESAAWRRLEWHHREIGRLHLRDLFAGDPGRGERMTAEAAGLYLDYSKHRITDDTLQLLRRLAVQRNLEEQIRAMFRGERVNVSEGRAALHVALRMPRSRSLVVDGVDVVKEVHEELDRMSGLAEQLRTGSWLGATGQPIRAVVNIGIGGSDLGPAMTYEALRPVATRDLAFRFVSNVDPASLGRALEGLDPAETLFVVVSKTMSTLETIENAKAARAWLEAALGGEGLERHFVGAAANVEAGAKIGIPPENTLRFWDWVGGRTSLCSAAGFSLVVALGPDGFRALLDGFHAMDYALRERRARRERPGAQRAARRLVPELLRRRDERRRPLQPRAAAASRVPAAALDGVEREERRRRTATRSRWTPAPCSGAARGRTRSTPSSSCCTRERCSLPPI